MRKKNSMDTLHIQIQQSNGKYCVVYMKKQALENHMSLKDYTKVYTNYYIEVLVKTQIYTKYSQLLTVWKAQQYMLLSTYQHIRDYSIHY